jgi:flagellar basal body-associated protein FliL
MQHYFSTLLIGMPGGAEWIIIIIALFMIVAPIVIIIYLFNKYLNSKKDKQVLRKL